MAEPMIPKLSNSTASFFNLNPTEYPSESVHKRKDEL